MFLGVVLAVHLAHEWKVGIRIEQRPRRQRPILVHRRRRSGGHWINGLAKRRVGLLTSDPVLLTAGLLGASLVFAIAWLIPQAGAETRYDLR